MHAIVAPMTAYETTETAAIQLLNFSHLNVGGLVFQVPSTLHSIAARSEAPTILASLKASRLYLSAQRRINRSRFDVASVDSKMTNLCALRVRSVLLDCLYCAHELVTNREGAALLFVCASNAIDLRFGSAFGICDWMMSDRRLLARESERFLQ